MEALLLKDGFALLLNDGLALLLRDNLALLALVCLGDGGSLEGPGRSEELRGVGRGEGTDAPLGVSEETLGSWGEEENKKKWANVTQTTQQSSSKNTCKHAGHKPK